MRIEEKEQLDEMSIRVISAPEDKLPFKIAVKCPDQGDKDHAHIIKLKTKDDEIGALVITHNAPQSVKDLVGFKDGKHEGLKNLTLPDLQAIVLWANQRNSLYPGTNWQTLQYEYAVNRRK